MIKFLLLVCSLAAIISSVFGQAFGPRYESYLCASPAHRNDTFGFFSCHEDCQLSHGADGGSCWDPARINRFNCKCGNPTGRLPVREQQCLEPSDGYNELCVLDCRCNHGADTGRCDYRLKACFCEGYNPMNNGCPAYSFEHFKMIAQVIFKVKVGKLGPSWLYQRFHH